MSLEFAEDGLGYNNLSSGTSIVTVAMVITWSNRSRSELRIRRGRGAKVRTMAILLAPEDLHGTTHVVIARDQHAPALRGIVPRFGAGVRPTSSRNRLRPSPGSAD